MSHYTFYPLKNIIVYLVLFILTMGIAIRVNANPTDEEIPRDQNILYLLLVAEMAAQRQDPKRALKNYLIAANMTTDPNVAKQATLLAISMEAPDEAIIGAELWANKNPTDLQAQLIATTLLIGESIERAIPYLVRAIELEPEEVDQYIIQIQARLSEKSASNLKKALNRIALERSSDPYTHLIAAQSAANQKDIKNANRWIDSALKQKPDLTRAIILKSRLIRYEQNSDIPAIHFLAKKLEQFPKNKELRFFYARALLDNEKNEEAKAMLLQLTEDKNFGGLALLLLSELYLKENQWKAASNTLQKAVIIPQSKDGALYLLGEIDEHEGHVEMAIERYSSIAPGPYHIPGILRAIPLLKKNHLYKEAIQLLHNSTPTTIDEQKNLLMAEIDLLNASKAPEEAMQLADEILLKLPNDADVLYLRALTATKLQKWDVAENDLKNILKQNPNNASALNALGYTLIFSKERLPEAIQYLKEALSLTPNNPHFMDNIGWAYYHLGDFQQAIAFLEKATDLSQDSKIAAHFGEVLWMNNQKNKAITVWKKAMEKDTEQEELLDTLKRLKVKF